MRRPDLLPDAISAPIMVLLVLSVAGLFTAAFAQPAVTLFESPAVNEGDAVKVVTPAVWERLSREKENAQVTRQRFLKSELRRLGSTSPPYLPHPYLTLNLFPDVSPTARLEKVEPRGHMQFTWIGSIPGESLSQVILVVDHDNITGNIWRGGQLFQIRPIGDGVHVIKEINQSAFPAESAPIPAPTPQPQRSDVIPPQNTNAAVEIDVMVVYTAAAAAASTEIGREIQLAIDEANVAYWHSGINQRLRLVHTAEVSYTESGSTSTDLDRLRLSADGFMDEIHGWRDTYGADIVSLWVSTGGCGVAYVMTAVSSTFSSLAFNVCELGCATGNLTFAHETGHNMSARHDWYIDPTDNSPFPYNHGYKIVSEGWRTIMSYNDECVDNGTSCQRLPYFSNPDTTHPLHGSAMGIPDGSFQAADNRQALNNTAATIAAFRTPEPYLYATPMAPKLTEAAGSAGLMVDNIGASTANWTAAITSGSDWLSITGGGSGANSGTVSLSFSANTAATDRQATVELTSAEAVNSPLQVTITQFGTRDYATLPYSTGFETGALDQYWRTESDHANGRIQVTGSNFPHAGSFHLTMDVSTSGPYVTNEAWLHLNLAGMSDVTLDFWWKDSGDETHFPDGVFFSDDGGRTFTMVHEFFTYAISGWTNEVLNMDALAAAHGLSLSDSFVVKFSQYDNFPFTSDGIAIDDISVTGTPSAQSFTQNLISGWNLIGLPLEVSDAGVTTLYPTHSPGTLFRWEGVYQNATSLDLCQGYWLNFDQPAVAVISGTAHSSCSISLIPGWNLIAGPACDVAVAAISDPEGAILPGTIFGWSGAYSSATTIAQGQGYWVNAGKAGTITLNCADALPKSTVLQVDRQRLDRESRVLIRDAAGAQQILYFGVKLDETLQKFNYQLPPVPPAPLFDARFRDDTYLLPAGTDAAAIRLQTAHYPVEVMPQNLPAAADYALEEWRGAEMLARHPLRNGIPLHLPKTAAATLRLTRIESAIPSDFVVYENFPNPFNPDTEIRYALPQRARVTVAVYNSLGQKVKTLLSAEQDAGMQSVTWDGTDEQGNAVASGLYLYRIMAATTHPENGTTYRQVRKMILMR